VEAISSREAEVLDLVGAHMTNGEIAARLYISVRTVESHVSSLLRKVEVADRRALAAYAARGGAGDGARPGGRPLPSGGSSSLPDFVGRLWGRDSDIQSLAQLVRDHRVVTISGPGGVGKTRTAVELGRLLVHDFNGRVSFVGLADVTDPDAFVDAVADALDVKEAEGRTLGEGLVSLIGDDETLLVLDNLEQIVEAAPKVSVLAERCPKLHIVTTSRMPLRIAREKQYQLAPLELPPSSGPDSSEAVLGYSSVALFVERAKATRESFVLTAANAEAIAGVCRRLDGLPLALELAASRLRVLSPSELLERLDRALDVLTSGRRDSPARHQTIRATIDWSHSLLTDSEQRLFRRMAVLGGGGAFVDVEAICSDPGEGCLDELESLVDKALVQAVGDGRLRMLETIREYAREKLDAAGETVEISMRHSRHYAAVACEIRDGIEGTDQVSSIQRGIVEESNLQAALDMFQTSMARGDTSAGEAGVQMCGDLWLYWHIRGKHLTAQRLSDAFLRDAGGGRTRGRAAALVTAGLASWTLGQYERANAEWGEAFGIADELDSPHTRCVAGALWAIGLLGFDLDEGLKRARDSIDASRASSFVWCESFALTVEAILSSVGGDFERAQERYLEALAIQQPRGDHEGAGLALGGLAALAAGGGDPVRAFEFYAQSLAAFEAIGDCAEEARILSEVAWTHVAVHDTVLARRWFMDSVRAYTDVASVRGIGLCLIGLAATAALEGRPEAALQIAAAAEKFAEQEGIVNVYSNETPGEEIVNRARATLSAEAAKSAEQMGRTLTFKQALALAL
jgi:predicted ATPase/DNA-binding CsgD family transcriptional regulator